MALRPGKHRDVEKASYYVWFLGALEARGLRGRQFVAPVVRELMRKEEHVDPSKVTLQVSEKGLKIVQHVAKKGGKGRTEPVKHFIPDHAITFATQEPTPDRDIVSCILLIFNPVTKCPVHVHTYRCDSAETAAALVAQLQTLAARPDNQAHIEEIERRLLERGLLEPPTPPPSERSLEKTAEAPASAEKAASSGGRSAGSAGAPGVPTLHDSLADELRAKIGRKGAPLLMPPKDYDTATRAGKTATQEDSSGIGSDDAPSPDHRTRDRDRTSSDEEWEAAGQSTEDLLLATSCHWRHGPGWEGGRRSADARSGDTDELLAPSSRKTASQRQRSPSASPQDRFQNARLKFVQMEQKQPTPPPVVAPKKQNSTDFPSPDGEPVVRDWRSPGSPERPSAAILRSPSTDKGWRLPQPTKDELPLRGSPDERGWIRPSANETETKIQPTAHAKERIPHREQRRKPEEPNPRERRKREEEQPEPHPTTEEAAGDKDTRRDARGRPHVADIFRYSAPVTAKPRCEDDFKKLANAELVRSPSDIKHKERGKSAVRANHANEKSSVVITDSDPRPDEVHARVDRWVRSSAQATPFTRAMSFEEPRIDEHRSPITWDAEPASDSPKKSNKHSPSDDKPVDAIPNRLSKSRSTEASFDAQFDARHRPVQAASDEHWKRSSALIAAEVKQRSRATAPEPEVARRARSPVARHHSLASAKSDPRPAERRHRYQELHGNSRLPGLDRDTARDPMSCPQDVIPPRQRPLPLEMDYRREPPRRRDRSCDIRDRTPADPRCGDGRDSRRTPVREQRRDDREHPHRTDAPRARSRNPDERYRPIQLLPSRNAHDGKKSVPYPKTGYEPRRGFPDVRGAQLDYRAAGVPVFPY